MSEPLWNRPRKLLNFLIQLAAERARAEKDLEFELKSRKEAADKEFSESRRTLTTRSEAEKEVAECQIRETRQQLAAQYEAMQEAAGQEFAKAKQRITYDQTSAKKRAEKTYQDARWALTALQEETQGGDQERFQELQQRQSAGVQKIQALQRDAGTLMREWRQHVDTDASPITPSATRNEEELVRELEGGCGEAEKHLARLRSLVVPRYFKGLRPLWFFLVLWLAAVGGLLWAYPSGRVDGRFPWWLVSTGGALLVWLALTGVLYALAALRVQRVGRPLWQTIAEVKAAGKQCEHKLAASIQRHRAHVQQRAKSRVRLEKDLQQAEENSRRVLVESQERYENDMRLEESRYQRLMAAGEQRHDAELRQAEVQAQKLLAQIKARFEQEMNETQRRYTREAEECRQHYETTWNALAGKWRQGMAWVDAEQQAIGQENERIFPEWNSAAWNEWTPPADLPLGIRFGEMQMDLAQVPHGVPADERLRVAPAAFTLPAMIPLPRDCSMLIKAKDAGRTRAVQLLQAVMLRFLTAIPPGKVRFTIIDPVGRGENFAAFMNLADYDDSLVASRIWTELQHIEQRLADMTEHMENVIQKYLRNQFQTIDEYNAQAGEVAEPFRILVIANFPANFSADAARRLVSIATSGARCGVFTLISVDTKMPVPQGFNLSDLEQPGVLLVGTDEHFAWKDRDFEALPLRLEAPPEPEFCTRILQKVGERARDASRVEVPFDFIAPAAEDWWKGDSRSGLTVPLGRAGATKRQLLKLGQGTAQHVLITGKTGSGKSTLLHALITNLSLLYGPDEVELFLVDFKKGVEFKTYAQYELPHARVIAIESEREFGLSVLQRLDQELKQRGDRFRELNVQDLAGYRQATGDQPLPRILLIVDEFQEFFVEDDKIAQDAALLLDRLVRQGRAFGIHIHLGSQTLGGAYSLARSTLDQMAVRIVLQCSEADAHLILAKDNSAARLLSRPGEAIYNDANGLVEGNNPFQVVWLPEERREDYLRHIRAMAEQRGYAPATPAIVFEGNAPADIGKNPLLAQFLEAKAPPYSAAGPFHAWLGEAMAIKDATAATFRPQSGSNLLVIGQQEEPALAITCAALVGLAAQLRPAEAQTSEVSKTSEVSPGEAQTSEASKTSEVFPGTRFLVLDGGSTEGPLAGTLARVAEALPGVARVAGWRDLAKVIGEVADEVNRCQKANETESPPLYLFIHGLQRFRDLRRSEDDFGFSRRGGEQPPSPSKQFATILRDGPGAGVYTLIWCDSLNNLNRALDRQGLREFELRVLFQMSAADSSTLIDSPLASKLGLHRALFYTEERGQPEKFRPYGLPTEAWLGQVKDQLQRRMRQPAHCTAPS